MTHKEANIKVYYTREYNKFRNILGNRLLNESKIKRIMRDIEGGLDMLRYCPIIVDNDMNVIDGQHRLWVAKKLKSNVWYMIAEKLELHEIARINSNTERWSAKDFIHCYTTQGNAHYKKLQKFIDDYNCATSVAITLLANGGVKDGGGGKQLKEKFERGEFQVKFEKEAKELMELAGIFASFPDHMSRPFLLALSKINAAGLIDWAVMMKKFSENPECLYKDSTDKGYLAQLELVYNRGAHKRKTIF